MDFKIIEKSIAHVLTKNEMALSAQHQMLIDATLVYFVIVSTRRGRNAPSNERIHGHNFENIV